MESLLIRASLLPQRVKHLSAVQETWVQSLGWEDALEDEMATHSGTLAWRSPWMEESGRLQSMGLQMSDTTEQLHFHFLHFHQGGAGSQVGSSSAQTADLFPQLCTQDTVNV